MLALSTWRAFVDIATGLLAVLVLWLIRVVFELRDRLTRLEALVNGRRPSRRG